MQRGEEISNYCERIGSGFWDEPFNAWTNLAFAIAAIGVWILIERAGPRPQRWTVRTLAILIFAVFLGSGAWHTTASRWGVIADSGSIALYLLFYVVLFTVLFWDLPWRVAWLAAPLFIGFTLLVSLGASAAGIPGQYLSALIALFVLGGSLHWAKRESVRPYGIRFAGIGLLFAMSLTARELDGSLCEALPIGTHFLWHTFNGAVLYLTARLAVRRWRELNPTEAETPRA